jgi:hypothetical protein
MTAEGITPQPESDELPEGAALRHDIEVLGPFFDNPMPAVEARRFPDLLARFKEYSQSKNYDIDDLKSADPKDAYDLGLLQTISGYFHDSSQAFLRKRAEKGDTRYRHAIVQTPFQITKLLKEHLAEHVTPPESFDDKARIKRRITTEKTFVAYALQPGNLGDDTPNLDSEDISYPELKIAKRLLSELTYEGNANAIQAVHTVLTVHGQLLASQRRAVAQDAERKARIVGKLQIRSLHGDIHDE